MPGPSRDVATRQTGRAGLLIAAEGAKSVERGRNGKKRDDTRSSNMSSDLAISYRHKWCLAHPGPAASEAVQCQCSQRISCHLAPFTPKEALIQHDTTAHRMPQTANNQKTANEKMRVRVWNTNKPMIYAQRREKWRWIGPSTRARVRVPFGNCIRGNESCYCAVLCLVACCKSADCAERDGNLPVARAVERYFA